MDNYILITEEHNKVRSEQFEMVRQYMIVVTIIAVIPYFINLRGNKNAPKSG